MSEINVTPLVDVMLVLLVIFIITAPLLTHAVKIDLPKAASAPNLTKPDNIPIVFMLVLVLFFTWVGLKQALRNDRLIEQGREEDVLKEMQR